MLDPAQCRAAQQRNALHIQLRNARSFWAAQIVSPKTLDIKGRAFNYEGPAGSITSGIWNPMPTLNDMNAFRVQAVSNFSVALRIRGIGKTVEYKGRICTTLFPFLVSFLATLHWSPRIPLPSGIATGTRGCQRPPIWSGSVTMWCIQLRVVFVMLGWRRAHTPVRIAPSGSVVVSMVENGSR